MVSPLSPPFQPKKCLENFKSDSFSRCLQSVSIALSHSGYVYPAFLLRLGLLLRNKPCPLLLHMCPSLATELGMGAGGVVDIAQGTHGKNSVPWSVSTPGIRILVDSGPTDPGSINRQKTAVLKGGSVCVMVHINKANINHPQNLWFTLARFCGVSIMDLPFTFLNVVVHCKIISGNILALKKILLYLSSKLCLVWAVLGSASISNNKEYRLFWQLILDLFLSNS